MAETEAILELLDSIRSPQVLSRSITSVGLQGFNLVSTCVVEEERTTSGRRGTDDSESMADQLQRFFQGTPPVSAVCSAVSGPRWLKLL